MRSSRKKILIIGSLPPPAHGCNVFIREMLSSDLRQRFDLLHLDTSDRRNLDNLSRLDVTNVRLAIQHVIGVIGKCLRHRPDLAHLSISQNSLGYLRDGLFLLLIKFFSGGKTRIVIHLHGSYFLTFYQNAGWLMRRFVDVSLRCVSRAIVLGEGLRPIFHRWLPDSRISVVPNGSPLLPHLNGKFERNGHRPLQVIYLGNLFKFKGVLDIIQAATLVLRKDSNLKFRLAGNWGYDPVFHQSAESIRAECEACIDQTGLPDHFEFVGELTGAALEDYLVDGDIFVFPSMVEGMPLVIIEAMAAGNPIISTAGVGAIPEIIRHGENGLLVEKQNPEALARALLVLIHNPALRTRLGRAARQCFEESYTKEKSIERLAEVFAATLAEA